MFVSVYGEKHMVVSFRLSRESDYCLSGYRTDYPQLVVGTKCYNKFCVDEITADPTVVGMMCSACVGAV